MIIEFDFLPTSVNQCFATNWNTRRRFKTKKYAEFIARMMPILTGLVKEPLKGDLEVEYNFYFPDKRRRDVFNLEKAMSDTLVLYGVIEDDSQIVRGTVEKAYDKGKPYTVVEIKKL